MKTGMGSHERAIEGETNEWLTPPHILEALGPFDLDPCAPVVRPWEIADAHYTIEDDGLSQPWHGFVWVNPPYGPHAGAWLEHAAAHGNGLALIFARTETKAWRDHIWARAEAVGFLHGRLRFFRNDGTMGTTSNAGAPSALVAYGVEAVRRIKSSGLECALVTDWSVQ